jgi:beta-mannosidase
MRKRVLVLISTLLFITGFSQPLTLGLTNNWRFRHVGAAKWYKAEVPGTVHTDLLNNKLIPDPFYRDNENKVQWVEEKTWEYQTVFDASPALLQKKNIELQFDGLDTYAEVVLNGSVILQADNMFVKWTKDIRPNLHLKKNLLVIRFLPSSKKAREMKDQSKYKYPDNERVFVRKAQYQFGWDWGPRLVTCGIWKDVRIVGWNKEPVNAKGQRKNWNIRLITQKDSIGESFYFAVNGKPTFIKGANWIPLDNFLPRAKKLKRYEQLISAAKEANINMLRVWGGGVYEDDVFYDLCDRYGIMVWQDFMFAGALYPADSSFLRNIENEVRYQVKRLRNHSCIALWCGNNEIEEAWFNWGWQKQFNYSAEDSTKLWNDYKKIFHQLIPEILKELDPQRRYWPSSPSLGWGRDSAYKKGDVHYWGVWWGKEPVEKYREKVGRFNSEYGMQGMPDMKTIKQFSLPQDLDTASAVMKTHQKHPFGYENIKMYIENKFRTPKSFEDLVYVSQLMQADAIKTAIEAHRKNMPATMGTMFWQWNDCWPVTSWSAVDYYGRKKAMFYEVKRSYQSTLIIPYLEYGHLKGKYINEINDEDIKMEMHIGFFDGGGYHPFHGFTYENTFSIGLQYLSIDEQPFDPTKMFILIYENSSSDSLTNSRIILLADPKNLELPKPNIQFQITNGQIEFTTDKFAYGVFIDVPDGVELEDNYFHLLPNQKKIVKFTSTIPVETIKKNIRIKSLVDTY